MGCCEGAGRLSVSTVHHHLHSSAPSLVLYINLNTEEFQWPRLLALPSSPKLRPLPSIMFSRGSWNRQKGRVTVRSHLMSDNERDSKMTPAALAESQRAESSALSPFTPPPIDQDFPQRLTDVIVSRRTCLMRNSGPVRWK